LRIACGKIPHIFHAHSLPKFSENDPRLPLRRGLMHTQRVLCVSEPVADAYKRRGFRDCVLVPNGVDFARLDESKALPLPHPLALCFGYDFTIKGIDTALTAFERYDAAHEWTLGVCAAGHLHEAERALCERYGEIPPWVRLLPGREDVGAYYRSADVFLSASRQEGMPYAVLEAAYCTLPLALSDIAPHTSLGLSGARFFPKEDAEALFEAVRSAADDGQGERRRQEVQQRYSLEKWTSDVLSRLIPHEERIL
jgi:glycosyltransferase involved in cell wall biosynthesis